MENRSKRKLREMAHQSRLMCVDVDKKIYIYVPVQDTTYTHIILHRMCVGVCGWMGGGGEESELQSVDV